MGDVFEGMEVKWRISTCAEGQGLDFFRRDGFLHALHFCTRRSIVRIMFDPNLDSLQSTVFGMEKNTSIHVYV